MYTKRYIFTCLLYTSCKTAQSLVIPYINDQLSDEETEDFLEHIENCKECYEELEIHFTVHYALQKLDEDDKIAFNTVSYTHLDVYKRQDIEIQIVQDHLAVVGFGNML